MATTSSRKGPEPWMDALRYAETTLRLTLSPEQANQIATRWIAMAASSQEDIDITITLSGPDGRAEIMFWDLIPDRRNRKA